MICLADLTDLFFVLKHSAINPSLTGNTVLHFLIDGGLRTWIPVNDYGWCRVSPLAI